MKKFKLIIVYLLIGITFLSLSVSIIYKFRFNSFEKEEIINKISFLTSDELEGRLCGSQGNFLAQNFIVDKFKEMNLTPYKENYLHEFSVYHPTEIEGTPYLKVMNSKGEEVKRYNYNKDFKDTFLNFKINNISFDKRNKINIYPSAFTVKDTKGNSAVFVSSELSSFNFRSSFVYDTPGDLYTTVTKTTFNELIDYYKNGYSIECFFPYKIENTQVNNVAGIIKGKNSALPPLALTAHFDHMGKDLEGNIYRGALDNASGISFLIELASLLNSLPTPERDIIIVALNAEEFGLLGAKYFAQENKDNILSGKVINFDMIGSDDNIPITLMTGQNPEDKKELIDNLIKHCKNKNLAYIIESKDSSDHASFLHEGIDSVTVNDGDISKIHTPMDTVEHISKSAMDRAFSVVWPEIYNLAYTSSPLFLIDTRICLLLFSILILLVALAISLKRQSN